MSQYLGSIRYFEHFTTSLRKAICALVEILENQTKQKNLYFHLFDFDD